MHVFTVAPIAVLWTIYVRPEYRHGAVGRRLIYSAIDIAKGEGACAFFAIVTPDCHAWRSITPVPVSLV